MSITYIAVESHTVSILLTRVNAFNLGVNSGVLARATSSAVEHQVEGDNGKEGPMARAQVRQRPTSTEPKTAKRGGIKIYN